jgi:NAD(P)-dependent dehydrogenase (short-subunit alcohol dehydrogenase family)
MVVTGAGRGLGRALAIVAAERGAETVLLGRDLVALGKTGAAIGARTGMTPLCVECDLARPASIAQACRNVLSAGRTIDVLVNNAAPWLPGNIDEASEEAAIDTIGATVTGTILVTKGLLPALEASPAADIVTIVSTAGLINGPVGVPSAIFHAAKHGQSGFADRLRHELKPRGIRVTAIYPPDFSDIDPLDADWERPRDAAAGEALGNRDVVATILFAITAPRACAYPMIVLDNMRVD